MKVIQPSQKGRVSKTYRLRDETIKLANKLNKSRKKPNEKIFLLLTELEGRREPEENRK